MEPIKVVINNCFGGFGLSAKAIMWMREHGSEEAKAIPIWLGEADYMEERWCTFLDLEFNRYRSSYNAFGSSFDRQDPILVACVEALGDEANGSSAKLIIEKLYPPSLNIEEWDGKEHLNGWC